MSAQATQRLVGLRNYFIGRSFDLVSPLPLEEVKQRIRDRGGSIVSFGLRARVRGNRVRIEWRMPLVKDRLAPRFKGKFEDELGRTRLRGRYVSSLWARFLLGFCGFFVVWMLANLALSYAFGEPPDPPDRNFMLGVSAFLSLPILLELISRKLGKRDLYDILTFLEREAMFTPYLG